MSSGPSRCGKARFAGLCVFEHLLHTRSERARDAEGKQKGREVFPRLQRHDGVARDSRLFRQFILRHLAVLEAEAPDVVADLGLIARHDCPCGTAPAWWPLPPPAPASA